MSILRFVATVAQVKTMADGGLRLSLDLSEKEIDAATSMMQAKQMGAILECAIVPVLQERTEGNGEIREGQKRKSEWTTAQEPGAH